jgi:hypothetical protein
MRTSPKMGRWDLGGLIDVKWRDGANVMEGASM